jgi:hypothetical protein
VLPKKWTNGVGSGAGEWDNPDAGPRQAGADGLEGVEVGREDPVRATEVEERLIRLKKRPTTWWAGEAGGIRTHDSRLKRPLLCH